EEARPVEGADGVAVRGVAHRAGGERRRDVDGGRADEEAVGRMRRSGEEEQTGEPDEARHARVVDSDGNRVIPAKGGGAGRFSVRRGAEPRYRSSAGAEDLAQRLVEVLERLLQAAVHDVIR